MLLSNKNSLKKSSQAKRKSRDVLCEILRYAQDDTIAEVYYNGIVSNFFCLLRVQKHCSPSTDCGNTPDPQQTLELR